MLSRMNIGRFVLGTSAALGATVSSDVQFYVGDPSGCE